MANNNKKKMLFTTPNADSNVSVVNTPGHTVSPDGQYKVNVRMSQRRRTANDGRLS